jgi:hypothetical protein
LFHFFQVLKKIPPPPPQKKIKTLSYFITIFAPKIYVLMKMLTFTCSTTFPICDSTGIAPKYFPLNFALGKMKCGLLSFTSTTFTLTCRKLIY